MLISHLNVLDEPDRLPAGKLLPEPPPSVARGRSAWPVDETAALFLILSAEHDGAGPTEFTSWSAFVERFGLVGTSPRSMNAVRGYFANGGRRAVVAPYVGDPDSEMRAMDVAGTAAGVATIVSPDLYRDGSEDDVARAVRFQQELTGRAEQSGDRLVIVDPPPDYDEQTVRAWRTEVLMLDSWFAACYHPWIDVIDSERGDHQTVPPSGHVAGLLAYSDLRHGVQKPPANEPIRGAVGIAGRTALAQAGDMLNPIGVNLIVARRGIVLWGARSMSSDPHRRSLHHCRSLHLIVRLLRSGLSWVDSSSDTTDDLWRQLFHDITGLLELLAAAGVLRRSRAESSASVRRVEDRAIMIELTLPGDLAVGAVRVDY